MKIVLYSVLIIMGGIIVYDNATNLVCVMSAIKGTVELK